MIKEKFDLFVDALEKNDPELLDGVLSENVKVDSSAIGTFEGIQNAKEKFKWAGVDYDYNKTKIFNNVVRKKGNRAWQTFYSVLIYGKTENNFINLFQCCFINALQWEDGRITSIKSNMTFECGNTMLVSNWWNLIDYKLEYGNKHVILDGVKDNPWLNCPENEIEMNDEELIQDAFNHYCLDLDLGNFDELANVATETMGPYSMTGGGRDAWIAAFKVQWARKVYFDGEEFVREAVWNHINTFKSLEINGDTAYGVIYRFEPNRIGTRFQHKYNLNSHYYSYIWYMNFRKVNGLWLLDGLTAGAKPDERGPWQVEYDMANKRYF